MKKHTEVKICFSTCVSGLHCICEHEMVTKLLNSDILTIMLKVKWEVTLGEREITNKYGFKRFRIPFNTTKLKLTRSLRYSAYCSLFHWASKKKKVSNYRETLPTCLVKKGNKID